MEDKDTIITVGATESDGYGNLWVTPQGGGEKIKIAAKRSKLHPIFEQGKAIILHWETYMNKPYVADAKPVEGELPKPQEPTPMTHTDAEYKEPEISKPSGQTIGMCWKEIGEMARIPAPPTSVLSFLLGKENAKSALKAYRSYLLSTLKIPYDGKKLPQWEKE